MPNAKNSTTDEKLKKIEALLEWFETEDITIEEALVKYEEALKLSKELEEQLLKAKNQVEIIKKKFS